MKQALAALLVLLPLVARSETYLVGVDHLNLRTGPSMEAGVSWRLRGGEEVSSATPEDTTDTGGRVWIRLEYDRYDGVHLVGWVAAEHLLESSAFRPYRPDAPKVVTYPLVDFETAYLLLPDGTFRVIEPKTVDGLYFGCAGAEKVIGNFCIKERGRLFVAGNVIWARGHKAFRLLEDGTVCSFLQEDLEPAAEDFTTCSSDTYMDAYIRLADQL